MSYINVYRLLFISSYAGYPCFQNLLCLLALLHDHPNVGLRCTLEIEILFNKLSFELANFQSSPVGFASPQFAAQKAAVVTLSSTAPLTEATVPSKTISAPRAADEVRTVQGDGVDKDYMPYSKKMHTGFQLQRVTLHNQ